MTLPKKLFPLSREGKEKKKFLEMVMSTARQTTTPFLKIMYDLGGFKSRLLPSQQLQVLLNSLFKVLCNFPSRYLFAIDLSHEYLALDGVYHQY